MEMKHIPKKKNWGKFYIHIIALIIVGDIIILNLPSPAWILRFVAVAYSFWLPAIGLLVIGLNPFTDCYIDSRYIRSGDEKKIRIAKIACRVFIIFFGLLALYIAIPVAKDALLLAKEGSRSLIPFEAEVIQNENSRYSGYFHQDPLLQLAGKPFGTDYYSLFFCHHWLRKGESYKFIITPNAKLILALEKIR